MNAAGHTHFSSFRSGYSASLFFFPFSFFSLQPVVRQVNTTHVSTGWAPFFTETEKGPRAADIPVRSSSSETAHERQRSGLDLNIWHWILQFSSGKCCRGCSAPTRAPPARSRRSNRTNAFGLLAATMEEDSLASCGRRWQQTAPMDHVGRREQGYGAE